MNTVFRLREEIINAIKALFGLETNDVASVTIELNVDKGPEFGDLSCNAALMLAKKLGKNPRQIAQEIAAQLTTFQSIERVEIAGPGFLNIYVKSTFWLETVHELLAEKEAFFKLDARSNKKKYLLEFVSANPTGPLHLGAGRNGIIGDVLGNVLRFLGHTVHKEFYINDAGNQVKLLGESFRVRCMQRLGVPEELPEGGYQGGYLVSLAEECVNEYGDDLYAQEPDFFLNFAKNHMLQLIKITLADYNIHFDEYFSEKSLHTSGQVEKAVQVLVDKGLAYEHEGALWFKSTQFGDEKDRVLRKSTGEYTYIAPDIAYHKNKFDRGYDILIDILGQDHHGYVKRLQSTMEALDYPAENLHVILYQLVAIKKSDVAVRMSKRSGNFTELLDVIEEVGPDVARFFYLNRKAEAHLDFDLDIALKKTNENPVYYIQYAYVRVGSLVEKAREIEGLKEYVNQLDILNAELFDKQLKEFGSAEIDVIKKMVSLCDTVRSIGVSYQTHLLAYYSWELAHSLHNYYTNNRIIDVDNLEVTKKRLLLCVMFRLTLRICMNLLGISSPEKM